MQKDNRLPVLSEVKVRHLVLLTVVSAVQVESVAEYGLTLGYGSYALHRCTIFRLNSSGEEGQNTIVLVDPVEPVQQHTKANNQPQDNHYWSTTFTETSNGTDHKSGGAFTISRFSVL